MSPGNEHRWGTVGPPAPLSQTDMQDHIETVREFVMAQEEPSDFVIDALRRVEGEHLNRNAELERLKAERDEARRSGALLAVALRDAMAALGHPDTETPVLTAQRVMEEHRKALENERQALRNVLAQLRETLAEHGERALGDGLVGILNGIEAALLRARNEGIDKAITLARRKGLDWYVKELSAMKEAES